MGTAQQNVGIVDLEIYYPKFYVCQKELEIYDDCVGKYTIGLGQLEMAVPSLIEDPISMALTVVHRFMTRTGLDYSKIGRLDVGTESSLDLSKSIKSHLMTLFNKSNNLNVQGADNINACYGGTAALFNCINWIESKDWDGRLALVVTTDISFYSNNEPSARATGGAAAMCLLIGPNSVLKLETSIKGHHMNHYYDFYKPINCSYPIVDGKLSQNLYIKFLLICSIEYTKNALKHYNKFKLFSDENIFAFHCPYVKLACKGFSYMREFHEQLLTQPSAQILKNIDDLQNNYEFQQEKLELEKTKFKQYTSEMDMKLAPSLKLCKRIGNCYCSSIFLCLASVLTENNVSNLVGKRIILFSYGSGSLSSMYSFKIQTNEQNQLSKLCSYLMEKYQELSNRVKVPPSFLISTIVQRVQTDSLTTNLNCDSLTKDLTKNTYYLKLFDDKNRRFYCLYN
uniref:Hydroxymethylglutaryl-CoA synthase n=1 Tax=Henneguya salminicola TaxID=69463 RepID=A0A6G3MDP7_HENSL